MFCKLGKLLIIAICFLVAPLKAAELETEVDKLITKHKINKNNIGIIIKSIKNKKPLVAINSQKMFTPASVVKLITTYAALLELGANYRWPTKFYVNGEIKNGILNGDLLIKGYGNPDLVTEDLEPIVRTIKNQGIKTIQGNIIIDRSYFNVSKSNSSGFDKNTHSPYNALADAMMFNHRASKLNLIPDKKTNKVQIVRDLPDSSFYILNQIKPSKQSCRGQRSWPHISFTSYRNKPAIKFSGVFSVHCPSHEIYKLVTKPYHMFYNGLAYKLGQNGIKINGTMKLEKVPENAKMLFTFESRPLLSIIAKINKKSNNVMARQTLLSLGAKKYGAGSGYGNGIKAINSSLQNHKITHRHIKLQNGSGLSRTAKLNARILSGLLQHGYDNFTDKWLNTLAVMGADGTLKKRLYKTNVKGRAWMKTGSLKQVRSIAGYIKAKSGKLYIVSMLHNGPKTKHVGRLLQDDIIRLVYSSL